MSRAHRTVVAALGELLRPDCCRSGRILLEETDAGSTCSAVELGKGGGDALVVKPDGPLSARSLFPLFQERPGLMVMCDYLVLWQGASDEPIYALLCELKSSKKPSDGAPQLRNAGLLADYIIDMGVHHGGFGNAPRVERRGIVFHPGKNVPKGNLHREQCRYQDLSGCLRPLRIAHYPPGRYPLAHFCC